MHHTTTAAAADSTTAVRGVLDAAGIPAARITADADGLPYTATGGYLAAEITTSTACVIIVGASGLEDAARADQRDGYHRQARAALEAAGWDVSLNLYGDLRATAPKEK